MTHIITHIETHIEKWDEEICDNCNHPVSMHYDVPQEVFDSNEKHMYVAEGYMALSGTRKMNSNPFLRCSCLHSV